MAEKSSELSIIDRPDNDPEIENIVKNYNPGDMAISTENAVSDEPSSDPEQIRGQIEETRRGMGETIDAIQEKLSLENLSEQVKEQVSEQINNAVETAKEAVYDATIRKAGDFMQNVGKELKKSNIVKAAGENPLPFVLIGIGAGILLFKRFNQSSSSKNRSTGFRGKTDKPSLLKSAQSKITDTAGQTYENVSKAAGTAYESVSSVAASAYQNVGSTAQNAYEKVGATAQNAYEKAGDLGTQAREKYNYHLEENPLAVGAVVLALGAAVGLAIPATRYENELLGEMHDQLMAKAEGLTRQAVDKVQEVAGEVGKTITDEVKNAVSEGKNEGRF